jgi:Ribbon-helix-helix protein, copG family
MVATEIHKSRWTGERIARLGFLLGLGWDAKRIAEDPIIASTQNNVHRQAQRFGLAFRAAAAAMSLRLPPDAASRFDRAAEKRGLTREAIIRLLLLEVADDPNLIDNILDDGV